MTKEELEHNHIKEIAEKYVYECWGTYLDLDEVDLVSAGIGVAKIISKEKDERIAELEEQNKKLLESCEGATMMYEDLCKAKKIIKELLDFDFLPEVEIKKQAEQFIK